MDAQQLRDGGWLKEAKGIYIIKMPMPFPLKENNCFLAETEHGWALIDTGVNRKENREVLKAVLAAIGITWRHISSIYLTHHHHDHIGLAGWLQEKCDASVYLSPPDIMAFNTYISSDSYMDKVYGTCVKAAWPLDMVRELENDFISIKPLLEPLPVLAPLHQDRILSLNGQDYDIIAIPGHTDGHCVFHSEQNQVLFSGDNIVGHTLLHLTDWPHNSIDNPCDIHLSALNQLQPLSIDTVLPGHGQVFSNINERITLINNHHNKRKAVIYDNLRQPMTAWELAKTLSKSQTYIHIRRLLLAETLAYLQSLLNEGKVEYTLVNGSYLYNRKSPG
ncbi:MAG: MBL fold metallo-hydrolase [Syntrophomonadaceae bacterium]|nr:MBL fold metallo-hydrolase [Syntrophomonadaceae bacterium]